MHANLGFSFFSQRGPSNDIIIPMAKPPYEAEMVPFNIRLLRSQTKSIEQIDNNKIAIYLDQAWRPNTAQRLGATQRKHQIYDEFKQTCSGENKFGMYKMFLGWFSYTLNDSLPIIFLTLFFVPTKASGKLGQQASS